MHPSELKQFWNFYAGLPARDLFDIDKTRLLRAVRFHTSRGWRELSALHDAACRIERERIAGNVVECGVGSGGSAAVLASVLDANRSRQLWMFDAWESLNTERSARHLLFRRLLLNPRAKHFVRGSFADTVPRSKDAVGAVALLHLDVDTLDAAAYCLDQFYEQVVPGGMVIIGGGSCADAREKLQKEDARFETIASAALLLRKSCALPVAG